MVLSTNAPETKFHQIINEVEEYMRHKKLPLNLQMRLLQYYDYRFQRTYFKESAILATLSSRNGCFQKYFLIKSFFLQV